MSLATGESYRSVSMVETGIVQVMPEDQVIDRIVELYEGNGVGKRPEQEVLALVAHAINDDEHIKASIVRLAASEQRPNTDLNEVVTILLASYHQRGFATAYVNRTVEQVLNGKKLEHHQTDTLQRIKKELVVKPEQTTEFYTALSTKLWMGVGTALDRGKQRQVNGIGQIIDCLRPSADHPSNIALSRALKLIQKIEDGTEFNDNEYAGVAKYAKAPVSAMTRPSLHDAAKLNYDIVVGQIASRMLRRSERLDDPKKLKYAALLQVLNVDPDVIEKISAEVRPDSVIDYLQQDEAVITVVSQSDDASGTFNVTAVKAQPRRERWHVNRLSSLATAAIIIAAGQQSGLVEYVIPNSSPSRTVADGVNPSTAKTPIAETSPVTATAEVIPAEPAIVEPAPQPEAVAPAIPLPSVGNGALKKLLPETTTADSNAVTTNNPVHQSTLPEVGINNKAVAQSLGTVEKITTSAVTESLRRSLVSGTIQQATDALVAQALPAMPEASSTTNTDFLNRVIDETVAMDQQAVQFYNDGKIDAITFLHYRTLVAEARMVTEYPALEAALGIDMASLQTDFVDAYIHKYLQKNSVLGAEATAANPLASLLIASASEQIIPESAQAAVLEKAQKNNDVAVESNDAQQAVPQPPDTTKQPPSTESTAANKEQTTSAEGSRELSETQQTALHNLAEKGPAWANRTKLISYFLTHPVNGEYLSLEQITGMIGNLWVESAGPELNPKVEQGGGGPGRGIGQWGNDTDQALDRYGYFGQANTLKWFADSILDGTAWDSIDTQIQFIHWELENTEQAAGQDLLKASSVKDAADSFMNKYERPAASVLGLRLDYAVQTFNDVQSALEAVAKQSPESTSSSDLVKYYAEQLNISSDAITIHEANGFQHIEFERTAGEKMLNIPEYGGYLEQYRSQPLDALVDDWNMYSRECVSYVAWRVSNDSVNGVVPVWGGKDNQPDVPGTQSGTAQYWAGNARAAGYVVDDTPTVGAAITWDTNGPEHSSMGHEAYVEKVMANGTIIISQYNNGGTGMFSISGITKADLQKQKNQIKFIHFDKQTKIDNHNDERQVAPADPQQVLQQRLGAIATATPDDTGESQSAKPEVEPETPATPLTDQPIATDTPTGNPSDTEE
ncbi:CHAP domain-containing protein [Aeromicrobium sp.]|nr:CHAP domain-containing protein [Candidatus Saccharibacteria bacterium]